MYKFIFNWFKIGFCFVVLGMMVQKPDFKSIQLTHLRVKTAYENTEKKLKKKFTDSSLLYNNFELLLIAYKKEKRLEVHIKSKGKKKYSHFTSYDFCVLSGNLGPKRKKGDGQVPEGLYSISNFNPKSNYHLSLKVNYPNLSDNYYSGKNDPGGDIYIHGNCVSIGCIPITDELIEELYVLCVETKNQKHDIPIYIFPFKFTDNKLKNYKAAYNDPKTNELWDDLYIAYLNFDKHKDKLHYSISSKGRYTIKD